MECPECKLEIPEDSKFCKECGHHLVNALFTDETKSLKKSERKHVTVLFSDMSGYTAMTERIDPEEVKEIMSLIFGKITDIIRDYDGFIERFVGDEVMAVFGVPKAHEDDPIRAIRAAIEIHTAVDKLSPRFEGKIGRSLAMHTGVNTGLVVTGEVNVEKGTHGLTGDAINLASRLEGIADANEILIGPNTYQQALNYFEFEALEPTKFKGKAELINVYKVLGFKRRPDMPHRMQGVQADLIGRNQEMAILAEAAQRLELGKGGIVCIVGEAGTGKSRLTREFKAKLDQDKIQWHEGHAYGYTQNSPYYPLANMLAYIFRIEEVDSQDQIRSKIESGLAGLIGQNTTAVHYIGGLFSIQYPETKNVSPEYWKSKLYDAVYQILNALVSHGPTIICFEDLHWADPSTVAMLTQLLSGFSESVLFLCVYRPGFDLFADNQLKGSVHYLQEIHLQDLNDAQTHQMLGSLLKSESMPGELIDFVRSKSEGNPFYLEEVVNSLIESEVLIQDNDSWKLIQQITEENIPPSIHGILAARIDRLETHVKRVLQEASVIGRAFLYNVLKRITDIKRPVDQYLSGLEQLDLIRARSMEPDLEYIFKHALTQEVAYNGLLKKDRQEIHERIGLAIEQLFTNRLPEFYESLAFHFKQSQSVDKAVNYLIKAGHKGQSKYALEEAHQYYKEAYDLLSAKPDKNGDDHKLLVDLLLTWAEVFHFRGAYSDLVQVMGSHEKLVQESNNQKNLGMLYAWLGTGLRFKEELRDSYRYLLKALELGESFNELKIIGHACCCLTGTCTELGLLEDAIGFGKRAQEISTNIAPNHDIFRSSLFEMGLAYAFKGDCKQVVEVGNELINYGRNQSDPRSIANGYLILGWGDIIAGDIEPAIENCQKAIQIAKEPTFVYDARIILGYAFVMNEQFEKAEENLCELVQLVENSGYNIVGTCALGMRGIVFTVRGQMGSGLKIVKEALSIYDKRGSRFRHANIHCFLGMVYLQIAQGAGPKSFTFFAKNFGFLIRNVPFATKKAAYHFTKAIKIANEIGAKSMLGQAHFNLGLLFKTKKETERAKEHISEAIKIFEICQADVYLKNANKALASL